jgi:uncharacterized protein
LHTNSQIGEPRADDLAQALRGFGPIGLVSIAVIVLSGNFIVGNLVVPVGAALVLVWARWSRTPLRDLGLARPASWIRTVVIGLAFGIALKFLMKAIVMPLFGADPVNQAFRHLTGNEGLLPAATWAMFVAGFGEEMLFRAYLFERLGKLLGSGAAATVGIVVLTSAWFGVNHYSLQGLTGVQQATIVGVLFGTIYALTRELWMLMVAHTAFDLTALAMIYWNLESAVAHLIFK